MTGGGVTSTTEKKVSDMRDSLTDQIDEIIDDDETDDAQSESDDRDESGSVTDDEIPERHVPSSIDSDDTLGHVLASEEIHVSRTDHQVNAFVRTSCRDELRLGDYVQIPYPPDGDSELFAVTDRLRYEPYTEFDDKTDAHNRISSQAALDEAEYVLVAELDPLSILGKSEDGEFEQNVVDRVPKPNAPVQLTRDEDRLRTGLGIPSDGVFAGWLSVGGDCVEVDGQYVPYYLSNPGVDDDGDAPAVFRHTLVAGSTGKGKTQFTKNILRQYVDGTRYQIKAHDSGVTSQKRLNVVLFDPENEYAQMADDNDLSEELTDRLLKHGVEYGGVDDLEVFVPQVSETPSPQYKDSRESNELTIPFEIVRGRPQLLMPFGGSPVTRGALKDCVSSYFEEFNQEDNGWETDRSVSRPRYEDFVNYVDSEEDDLADTHEIGSNTMSAVKRRIGRQEFNHVFDCGTGLLPDISNELFREGRVSVIPTSHLRGRKDTLTVLSILSYVIDNKIRDFRVNSEVRNTPILLAVDEAHNYFSSPETIQEEYVVERARRTVKQGRKYQLGLCLVTQNPQDIDDEILTQINTNVFLGMKSRVVEEVPSVPKQFAQDLPTFDRGQAVVQAPDVEPVEVQGLSFCVTRHS
ncbi:ATP-binding protein [Halorussus ruber]|uniref:ATP-binding protein n=1 Tax=Halorussus ruber TaxID=1126238 RepID=UPI001B2FEEC0|nr:ATP-binding protein [Halorussus ruber]